MKIYIGDGIYAELMEDCLILTTEVGCGEVTNRIVFESPEWQTLKLWVYESCKLREQQYNESSTLDAIAKT